jgi:Ca2+/Na+ antiporter
MKKIFMHSLLAGVLAGFGSVVYNYAYCAAMLVDYSKVIAVPALIGSCIFGCVLAGLGYWVLFRKWSSKADIWFNAIFLILSFASFMGPLTWRHPNCLRVPRSRCICFLSSFGWRPSHCLGPVLMRPSRHEGI